jgi:hypothetical protein
MGRPPYGLDDFNTAPMRDDIAGFRSGIKNAKRSVPQIHKHAHARTPVEHTTAALSSTKAPRGNERHTQSSLQSNKSLHQPRDSTTATEKRFAILPSSRIV